MNKQLPIFDIVLNEDEMEQGVSFISLVDSPAIGVNWITLGKEIRFASDKEKQLLYGPLLIPNMLIYRFDELNGEYYIRFSSEEIEKIANRFNENLNNKNINFQHTDQKIDAFVTQNWLIEGDQDKSRNFGFDLPTGTWFGSVKVNDKNFWNTVVKDGEVKGFSVEILADLEISLKNKIKEKMEKEIKLASFVLPDGTTLYYDGDFIEGTALFTDETLETPVPDGEYIGETQSIMVVGGLITEIKDTVVEEEAAVEGAPAVSMEEVSNMIDIRFNELMEELTSIKTIVDGLTKDTEEFKTEVAEKFKTTPAAQTVTKPVSKYEDKFTKNLERIRNFGK